MSFTPFTAITESQLFQPVYNPLWFYEESFDGFQPNFKFINDVYRTGVTINYLGRFKGFVKPGGLLYNDFSYARVLESELSYDLFSPNVIGFSASTNCIMQYGILCGQEYGDISTGTTTYSGISYVSGYTWNGVLRYQQIPNYSQTNYILTGSNCNFLTYAPDNQYIRLNERASLSFINYYDFHTSYNLYPQYIQIQAFHKSGGSKTTLITNLVNTGYTNTIQIFQPDNELINHFGCGLWNLSQIPAGMLVTGSLPIVNTNTDYKYTVTVQVELDQPPPISISETKTFYIDTSCSRYSPVRLMFLNSLGAFDYFSFLLVSRLTTNAEVEQYKKVLPFGYSVGDRQNTIVNTNATQQMLVTSDWINQATSDWLATELFTSKEVYEMQSDGSLFPVILDKDSMEAQKIVNDGLFNYEFNYTYSFDYNTQRG